eukprot:TRINITY_DN926_c0_g1_i4.p2 TRINITY_DN926_c0_g1~~TRINITY_DN926_c0_g1_i4.p2  ORF type:complete len:752 (-),score=89.96 TRINITY_DN926_c0_g1_i4:4162-6417(-)
MDSFGRMLIFGGSGFSLHGDLWAWSNENGFEYLSPMIPFSLIEGRQVYYGRAGSMLTMVSGNRLLVCGGFTYFGGDYYLNDVWQFDISNLTWTLLYGTGFLNPKRDGEIYRAVGGRPGGRFGAAIFGLGDTIGIYGGYGHGSDVKFWCELNDVWTFDLGTRSWTLVSGSSVLNQDPIVDRKPLGPAGRSFMSYAALQDGTMLVYDGLRELWRFAAFDITVFRKRLRWNYGDLWLLDIGLGNTRSRESNTTRPVPGGACLPATTAVPATSAQAVTTAMAVTSAEVPTTGEVPGEAATTEVALTSAEAPATTLWLSSAVVGAETRTPQAQPGSDGGMVLYSVVGVAAALVVVAVVVIVFLALRWRRRSRSYAMMHGADLGALTTSVFGHNWEISSSDVIVGARIGQGAYGAVFKATCRGYTCVVKRPVQDDDESIASFRRECSRMKSFTPHPNVVTMFGVCVGVNGECEMMLLEFMEAGSLLQHLQKTNEGITTRFAQSVLSDVAAGMRHIHAAGFVHADLAARNVLLTSRASGLVAKVADLGLSHGIGSSTQYTHELPIRWMAPEVLMGRPMTPASDVYSFGVLIYEAMQRGDAPWEDLAGLELLNKVAYQGLGLPLPTAVDSPLIARVDASDRRLARDTEATPAGRQRRQPSPPREKPHQHSRPLSRSRSRSRSSSASPPARVRSPTPESRNKAQQLIENKWGKKGKNINVDNLKEYLKEVAPDYKYKNKKDALHHITELLAVKDLPGFRW